MSTIHIVFGQQGAGKSTYAKQLATDRNAVHFSIDEWMWALYGADMPTPTNMGWLMERVARCEKRIWVTAQQIAGCGGSVVLDLGFMKVADRAKYITMAGVNGIAVQLYYIHAPYATRLKRVTERNTEKGNTFSFDVSPAMFDFMDKEFEAPTEAELRATVVIDTSAIN